jgi:hypothetical protein
MRIRTIKPEFWTNDELAELAPLTRLLFIGLWNMADRRGRLEDRPKRIKAAILPYDAVDVDEALDSLQDGGFITRYAVGDVQVIQVVNFEKHQRISGSEADSDSDLPPEKQQKSAGSTKEAPRKHQGSTEEAPRTTEGRKEGRKGREGKTPPTPPSNSDPSVVVVNGEPSPGDPDLPADTASGSEANQPAPAGPPVAADPADDPEVAAALGQGTVVPDDAEVHGWAKAWPGFPALGIPPAIDPAWLDRRLAWYASRRNPFPPDWRRDIELAYRSDWQSGRVKPSPKNGGPPSVDLDPAAIELLPKAARKLAAEDVRYVLTIRQKAPMLWQRQDEIATWAEKVETMNGGSRDGSPAHRRAQCILAALEEP